MNYKLSIIVPVFNEELRLEKTINQLIDFSIKENAELIFVNDGSTDSTKKYILEYKKNNEFIKLVDYKKNQGKGYAVKRGVLNSSSDLILITDSDLSTPLEEFYKLKKNIDKFDIVIGSRAMKNSNVKKKQFFLKVFFGRAGNFFIQKALGLKISDTQCGFKLFKKSSKIIFKKLKINRWGWDFEFLFLANKNKLKIKEVGVIWVNDEQSKVKPIDYLKTFNEVFIVRKNYFLGNYENEKK